MFWFTTIVLLALAAILGAWFLHRFYAKATLETAFVRTGLGGRKVIVDGGCLAIPLFHRLQKVSMVTIVVPVSLTERDAVMCRDQLRSDLRMEFEVRVDSSDKGVSTAAQSLGTRISRAGGAIQEVLTGFLADAIQNAAAIRSLEEIHLDRSGFTSEVAKAVEGQLKSLGLDLVSASIVSVDQANFAQLDENNAFHAQGMRRLAEIVSEQRKARVAIETAAEIAVRESKLAQHQRQLEIRRAERESEINQHENLTKLEVDSESRSSQARAEASLASETVQIERDREARAVQVANDEELRKAELKALLSLEEERIDNDLQLSKRRAEVASEMAKEEEAKAIVILAAEHVQAQKERAVAEREREISRLKQQREVELEEARVKREVDTLIARAKAKALATAEEAGAENARMKSEAEGRTALHLAENSLSEAIIRMRLEERRLDRMPEIMTQMMKPVEKIDSIKINQISGIGDNSSGSKRSGGIDGAFGAAMEQILGMAVRLPAMKKMGAEIGLDFDSNLAGRTADYANRIKTKQGKKS